MNHCRIVVCYFKNTSGCSMDFFVETPQSLIIATAVQYIRMASALRNHCREKKAAIMQHIRTPTSEILYREGAAFQYVLIVVVKRNTERKRVMEWKHFS